MTIYDDMIAAGEEVASHYSDLYVYVNPVTTAIIDGYSSRRSVTRFKSNTDGKMMYDIPFAFTPFWEAKGQRTATSC